MKKKLIVIAAIALVVILAASAAIGLWYFNKQKVLTEFKEQATTLLYKDYEEDFANIETSHEAIAQHTQDPLPKPNQYSYYSSYPSQLADLYEKNINIEGTAWIPDYVRAIQVLKDMETEIEENTIPDDYSDSITQIKSEITTLRESLEDSLAIQEYFDELSLYFNSASSSYLFSSDTNNKVMTRIKNLKNPTTETKDLHKTIIADIVDLDKYYDKWMQIYSNRSISSTQKRNLYNGLQKPDLTTFKKTKLSKLFPLKNDVVDALDSIDQKISSLRADLVNSEDIEANKAVNEDQTKGIRYVDKELNLAFYYNANRYSIEDPRYGAGKVITPTKETDIALGDRVGFTYFFSDENGGLFLPSYLTKTLPDDATETTIEVNGKEYKFMKSEKSYASYSTTDCRSASKIIDSYYYKINRFQYIAFSLIETSKCGKANEVNTDTLRTRLENNLSKSETMMEIVEIVDSIEQEVKLP